MPGNYSGDQTKVWIMGGENTGTNVAGLPSSTGQKTAAGSTSVVLASDQISSVDIQGDLVKVPLRPGYFQSEVGGTATATFQLSGIVQNSDGSGQGLSISVPTGLNNGAQVWFPFYGRSLGIRFRRDTSLTIPDFSVFIDGVAYAVTGQETYLVNEGITALVDPEVNVVLARDLSDGLHFARVVVVEPSSGTNSLLLHGYLAERSAGYASPVRAQQIVSSAVITTSQVSFAPSNTAATGMRFIRKVIYTNISGGAVVVTVQNGATVIWQKSIAAADSAEFDFGNLTAINNSLTHAAGSAAAINATIIGGY
jgi:hypothetical protein